MIFCVRVEFKNVAPRARRGQLRVFRFCLFKERDICAGRPLARAPAPHLPGNSLDRVFPSQDCGSDQPSHT